MVPYNKVINMIRNTHTFLCSGWDWEEDGARSSAAVRCVEPILYGGGSGATQPIPYGGTGSGTQPIPYGPGQP